MASSSAASLLGLPIRLHGIHLGRPTDVLVDPARWRLLGFVVDSGDGASRFLPYAAAQPSAEEIAVGSALMLLDDVDFYRRRGVSLRSLLGGEIEYEGAPAGELTDLVVDREGRVRELELDQNGAAVHVPPAGASVATPRATAA